MINDKRFFYPNSEFMLKMVWKMARNVFISFVITRGFCTWKNEIINIQNDLITTQSLDWSFHLTQLLSKYLRE